MHEHFVQLGYKAFNSWVRTADSIEAGTQLTDALSGRSPDPALWVYLAVSIHEAFREYLARGQDSTQSIFYPWPELLFYHKPDVAPAEFPSLDRVPPSPVFVSIFNCSFVASGWACHLTQRFC